MVKPFPILDLQRYLAILGLYDARYLDGKVGKMTNTAIHDFLEWHDLKDNTPEDQIIDLARAKAKEVLPLGDWTKDPDPRHAFTCELCLCAKRMGLGDLKQIAYMGATAEWETGNLSCIPNQEGDLPHLSKAASDRHRATLRYKPYWGRGIIHTTWEDAYRMLSAMLKVDLINNPDLLLKPQMALFAMVWSFKTGFPTSGVHPLARHIGEDYCNYVSARKCVNGNNKKHEIAEVAKRWENDLKAWEAQL